HGVPTSRSTTDRLVKESRRPPTHSAGVTRAPLGPTTPAVVSCATRRRPASGKGYLTGLPARVNTLPRFFSRNVRGPHPNGCPGRLAFRNAAVGSIGEDAVCPVGAPGAAFAAKEPR